MKFTLEIELGNDAMRDSNDVAEALLSIRTKLAGYPDAFTCGWDADDIKDSNGTPVGKWEVTE